MMAFSFPFILLLVTVSTLSSSIPPPTWPNSPACPVCWCHMSRCHLPKHTAKKMTLASTDWQEICSSMVQTLKGSESPQEEQPALSFPVEGLGVVRPVQFLLSCTPQSRCLPSLPPPPYHDLGAVSEAHHQLLSFSWVEQEEVALPMKFPIRSLYSSLSSVIQPTMEESPENFLGQLVPKSKQKNKFVVHKSE